MLTLPPMGFRLMNETPAFKDYAARITAAPPSGE